MFFNVAANKKLVQELQSELKTSQTNLRDTKAELREQDESGGVRLEPHVLIAQGRKFERDRFKTIINLAEFVGREKVALNMALDNPNLEPSGFSILLQHVPKASTGNQFAEYMAKLGNPDVGPDWDPTDLENEDSNILQSIAKGEL